MSSAQSHREVPVLRINDPTGDKLRCKANGNVVGNDPARDLYGNHGVNTRRETDSQTLMIFTRNRFHNGKLKLTAGVGRSAVEYFVTQSGPR